MRERRAGPRPNCWVRTPSAILGACALYHAGHDTELIKRWGRWASAAFHVYLWETAEQSKGVAKTMVSAPGTLIAARGLGSVELARAPRYEARRRRAVATATA